MRAPSSSTLLRLCTGLALVAAPVLLGARGCELGGSHEICTDEIAPVCGVDGRTYDNACEADHAGIEVAHDGSCETACYELYAPVCGDDGETYPNDCFARAAGAGIAHDGACECAPVACLLYCEFGSARDAAGCETCECNPPPVCEEVLCDLYCEHGFAIDPTTGCETCSCNEPPASCASDADCGAEEICLLPPCLGLCTDEDGDGACDDTCGAGVCQPREMEVRCSSDAECGEGAFCAIVGCTDDCPPDAECLVPSECFGFCRALPPPPPPSECTSDADCGLGATCELACTGACPPGAMCETDCVGFCRPSEPPPTYCDADVDCGPGARCEPIACTAVCEDGPDGGCLWDCPGGICVIAEPPPPTYCTSDAECAPGQACIVPEIACDCAEDLPCACPEPVGVCNDLPVDPTEPPPDARGV